MSDQVRNVDPGYFGGPQRTVNEYVSDQHEAAAQAPVSRGFMGLASALSQRAAQPQQAFADTVDHGPHN